MDLKDVPDSHNFEDRTNINNLFNGIQESSLDPRYHKPRPPAIDIKDLSDHERKLVDDYGFGPDDIMLMRTFHASPEQIINGWKLLKRDQFQ